MWFKKCLVLVMKKRWRILSQTGSTWTVDSIIRLSPSLNLHVNESRWSYGKEGCGYDERSDDVDDLSRNKHCHYHVGDALARHIKRAPDEFDAEGRTCV